MAINHNALIEKLKGSLSKYFNKSLNIEWHSEFSYDTDADIVITTKFFGGKTVSTVTQIPMQFFVDVKNIPSTTDNYDSLPLEVFDLLMAFQSSPYGNEYEFELSNSYTTESDEIDNISETSYLKQMVGTPTISMNYVEDGIIERTGITMEFTFVIIDDAVLFGNNSVYIDNVQLKGLFDISLNTQHTFQPIVKAHKSLLQESKLNSISETYLMSYNVIKSNALHNKLKKERLQNKEYTMIIYDGTITGTANNFETFTVSISSFTESNTLGGVKTAQITFVRK